MISDNTCAELGNWNHAVSKDVLKVTANDFQCCRILQFPYWRRGKLGGKLALRLKWKTLHIGMQGEIEDGRKIWHDRYNGGQFFSDWSFLIAPLSVFKCEACDIGAVGPEAAFNSSVQMRIV